MIMRRNGVKAGPNGVKLVRSQLALGLVEFEMLKGRYTVCIGSRSNYGSIRASKAHSNEQNNNE